MEEGALVRCGCSEAEHTLIGVWEWEIGEQKEGILGNGEYGTSVRMIGQNGDGITRTPPLNSEEWLITNEYSPVGVGGNDRWVVSEVEAISVRMCDGLCV